MSEVAEAGAKVATEGVGKFIKLIQDFNVIGFALGIMIGNNVAELANSFIDGVIMPTIDPILKKAGGKDMTLRIGGLTFQLEKFVQALMKFIGISIVIFVLLQLGINMNKPVTWVSIRSVKDGLEI